MERQDHTNNNKRRAFIPLILSLTLAAGILIGAVMFGKGDGRADIFKGALKIREILGYVENNYVDTVNADELVDVAISQMLEHLDPHTAYIPAKDVELANADLEGDFEGIGVQFDIIRDTIVVVSPLSGGPSEALGIKAGDKIIKVDDENVAGVNINNEGVFRKLRGKKGTKVKVSVKRNREKNLIDFTITRDKIPTYSVDASYMIEPKTGYIKISRFSNTTYSEFQNAVDQLKAKGMARLVLDLRDNPGGSMDAAERISDELLPENRLIVYTKGRMRQYDKRTTATGGGEFENGAVIVLLDEGSASASEIVAGALQDNDRALVVGRRSFGKGLVQVPIPLSDGSQLRLTISRYYTPSGRSIQKPYTPGKEKEYLMEVYDRRQHQENINQDSIKLDKSLKFSTKSGRTVYGGGGIMPDVFVPEDTSHYSDYLLELTTKDVIREFTLEYAEKNRSSLQKQGLESFARQFGVTKSMTDDLIAMAERAGIKYNDEQFKRSKNFIDNQIKALIARSIWSNEGFYRVWNSRDDDIVRALKLFDKAAALEKGKF